ncbi:MAG: AAA family ATPase [Planctomycetaceae bacterium]|nr:AAA family ATPase [Planctomycetaceae bacterium]
MSPLAGLTSLQGLYLTSTGVSDVSPLAGLTSLVWLYLTSTGVSDVSPLAHIEGLTIFGRDEIEARAKAMRDGLGTTPGNSSPTLDGAGGASDRSESERRAELVVSQEEARGQTAESSLAWHIERLDVSNFRGIARRQFAFPSRVTVLIGNNATGKTSAIETLAIAVGAFARGFDHATPRRFDPRDVRVESRGSLREPTVDPETLNDTQAEPRYPVSVRATGRVAGEVTDWIRVLEQQDGQPIEREEMVAWSKAQRLQRQVRNGESVTLPVFMVFPSIRRIDVPKLEPLETFPPGSRLQCYVNWQQPLEDLRPFMQWLKTRVLEAQQKGEPPPDLLAVQAAVRSAFEEAMFPHGIGILPVTSSPDETNSPPINDDGGSNENGDRQDAYPTEMQLTGIDWNIRQNWPEAVFSDGSRQRLGLLSDGQVGFLAVIAEIARRAAQLNPHFGATAAAKSPGIVLIDELDLHIHPRWQRTLIGDLKRTFPLMQFIIATHSALIVQQLQGDELINLDPHPPGNQDFRKLSAEEVLEDVMGNENTKRSRHFNEMQRVAAKYYELLEQRPDGDEEIAALKRELDRLIAPFSDDPAFHAFLERKRQRAGLGD